MGLTDATESESQHPQQETSTLMRTCPRCGNLLFGIARTCLVHGDQVDVGGRAPTLETVKDRRRRGGVDSERT